MNRPLRVRGQPMLALAVLLVCWIAVRALVWEPAERPAFILPRPAVAAVQGLPDSAMGGAVTALAIPPDAPAELRWQPIAAPSRRMASPSVVSPPAPYPGTTPPSLANNHEIAAPPVPAPLPYLPGDAQPAGRRWSADGWLMLRNGGTGAPIGWPARATYGASQLGAALRYRLAPASGHRPAAYLRAAAALERPHDEEVAVGLTARPIPVLPLTLAAELRVSEAGSDIRIRPSIVAVTELLPQALPLHTRAEAYAQAGYVGGAGATAFVDGQLRVDRQVTRIGGAELRAGGGVWGGAQEKASRLDLGPGATLGLPVGDGVFARLALDWRFRVAGDAEPDSGLAFTLSAGF